VVLLAYEMGPLCSFVLDWRLASCREGAMQLVLLSNLWHSPFWPPLLVFVLILWFDPFPAVLFWVLAFGVAFGWVSLLVGFPFWLGFPFGLAFGFTFGLLYALCFVLLR
jgi:hypothetical protein